jgi:hypothetical protein
MKTITSRIAGALAGLALSVGAGGALAWGEQPMDPQEESLIEGVEPQELSGSYDQDTSDDWFYDSYEVVEERDPFTEERDPFTEERDPFVEDRDPFVEDRDPFVEGRDPFVEPFEEAPIERRDEPTLQDIEDFFDL